MSLSNILARVNSFRYKLFLFMCVFLLSFSAIIISLWSLHTLADKEKSSVSYINNILKLSNDNFNAAISNINTLSAMITRDNNVIGILKKEYASVSERLFDDRILNDYIIPFYSYNHYVGSILISDLKDREINIGQSLSIDDIKKFTQFRNISEINNEYIILPPHEIGQTGYSGATPDYNGMVLSLIRPVVDTGSMAGVVAIDIKCKILLDFFNINLKDNGTVLVFDDKSNNFIFKPNFNHFNINVNEEEMLKAISPKISGDNGYFYTDLSGKDFLVVYYRSHFTNWTTIGMISKDKLLEEYVNTRNTTLLLSVLFIIFSFIASYFFSTILTKNLMKLNKAIQGFDGTNINQSITIKTHDEIGQLYTQYNTMVKRITGLIQDIKKSEKEKRKAEMKALQSQISPHFLYNALNTIKFLSVLHGMDNVGDVSESLSALMHINMEDRSFISIEEELRYLKNYLTIQEYKYTNKFAVYFNIEEGIGELMILKLLLQPIVENAINHGIAPRRGQGVINIKAYKEDNNLIFKIQDNGVGIDLATAAVIMEGKAESGGIGIRNVISRIKTNFGEGYGISILSEPGMYTTIEITLPVISGSEVADYA